MKVSETALAGVLVIEPKVFDDDRGFFIETWSRERYGEAGVPATFVQDNLSFSQRAVLRGLHYQQPYAQGKLVYVLQGEVFDVAVDIRRGSPTWGRWLAMVLSGDNKRQMYIPEGFAHGFCVVSDTALVTYKCTERHVPEAEGSLLWNDPDVGIEWPIGNPILSKKDAAAPRLRDIEADRLPTYRA